MRSAFVDYPRTRTYWLLQIVGWSFVLAELVIFYWPYVGVGERFRHFVLNMVLAFASTCMLRLVGRHFWRAAPHRIVRGVYFVALGLLCGFCVEAVSELVARFTWEHSEHLTIKTFFAESVDYVLLLGSWCVFYWGIKSFLEAALSDRSVREAHALARNAQWMALRSQIQPHFLLNALDATSSLLLAGYKDEAQSVVSRLNELLAAMLDTGEHYLVSLATELHYARKYLEVQQTRFGGRLRVSFDIQKGMESIAVPQWVLLPLLENAVRCGTAKHAHNPPLHLKVRRNDQLVDVTIENSTPEDKALSVNHGFGIGLNNTRALLRTIYGDAARLSAKEWNGLFVLKLEIPIVAEPCDGPWRSSSFF